MKYFIKAKKERYTRFAVVIPTVKTEVDLEKFFDNAREGAVLVDELKKDPFIELEAVSKVEEAKPEPKAEVEKPATKRKKNEE